MTYRAVMCITFNAAGLYVNHSRAMGEWATHVVFSETEIESRLEIEWEMMTEGTL